MATRAETLNLGPFAPESGGVSLAGAAGAAAGALAILLAILRPVLVATGAAEARELTGAAQVAGVIGAGLAFTALYQVGVQGRPGRGLARLGLALSSIGALGAFVYGADRDGSLRLDRFVDAYFDTSLIRRIAASLGRGLVNTLEAAAVAELLALGIGLVVATFAISDRRWLRLPARAYVDIVRGLPLLVLAFLINFGLTFIGITLPFFTSVVTILAVNASAYVAEIFRAGIQAVPRGQVDAARGLGMPSGAAMVHVVIPQAVRAVIPPLMNEFIALVKDTAIVFLAVGVTVANRDLFTAARNAASTTFSPTPYMLAAVGYLIVTVPLTRLVNRLERRLRAGLS